jgi:hypothetical protein
LHHVIKDDDKIGSPLGAYDNGVLILNHGFGHGDASFIFDVLLTFQNNILVNPGKTLGDTGQDIGLYNDLAFVVLNYE